MKKNETKIVCPKCGTEFEIPEQNHATGRIVMGNGTIVFEPEDAPVTKAKKRMEALKVAGVDVSGLFAMQTGDIARMENGVLAVVPDDDPIYSAILEGGTIPDRRLFRRWVMAQMFHLLTASHANFTENLRSKGVVYQWRVIEDELRTQNKLFCNDPENFVERNRWFNKAVVVAVCNDYLNELSKYVGRLKPKKCKGIPYVTISGMGDVFLSDLEKRVFRPINRAIWYIKSSQSPRELYLNYMQFKKSYVKIKSMEKMNLCFIDAYKGVGAYYTMKNLILFHGCVFIDAAAKKAKRKYKMTQCESMKYLEAKAKEYAANSEGWRLFGVMKKLIADNNLDIKAKMASWRKK